MIYQKHRISAPAMKKLLLLALFVFSAQLSPAQSKPAQKTGKATVKKTATTTKAAARKPAAKTNTATIAPKPVEKAPEKLIWKTPAMQEAMKYYTSLQFNQAHAKFKQAIAEGESDALYFLGRMHQYRVLKYDSVTMDTLQALQNRTKFFSANTDSARF